MQQWSKLTKYTIDNFAQGLRQAAEDFHVVGVPRYVTYQTFLRRGIMKAAAVRRRVIALKDTLKQEVRDANKEVRNLRELANYHRTERARLERIRKEAWNGYVPASVAADGIGTYSQCAAAARAAQTEIDNHINKWHSTIARRHYMRGYLKAKEEDRARLREILHSPRWQAPDNESEAVRFLAAQDVVAHRPTSVELLQLAEGIVAR